MFKETSGQKPTEHLSCVVTMKMDIFLLDDSKFPDNLVATKLYISDEMTPSVVFLMTKN